MAARECHTTKGSCGRNKRVLNNDFPTRFARVVYQPTATTRWRMSTSKTKSRNLQLRRWRSGMRTDTALPPKGGARTKGRRPADINNDHFTARWRSSLRGLMATSRPTHRSPQATALEADGSLAPDGGPRRTSTWQNHRFGTLFRQKHVI